MITPASIPVPTVTTVDLAAVDVDDKLYQSVTIERFFVSFGKPIEVNAGDAHPGDYNPGDVFGPHVDVENVPPGTYAVWPKVIPASGPAVPTGLVMVVVPWDASDDAPEFGGDGEAFTLNSGHANSAVAMPVVPGPAPLDNFASSEGDRTFLVEVAPNGPSGTPGTGDTNLRVFLVTPDGTDAVPASTYYFAGSYMERVGPVSDTVG